jgi:hypothetical protein
VHFLDAGLCLVDERQKRLCVTGHVRSFSFETRRLLKG